MPAAAGPCRDGKIDGPLTSEEEEEPNETKQERKKVQACLAKAIKLAEECAAKTRENGLEQRTAEEDAVITRLLLMVRLLL